VGRGVGVGVGTGVGVGIGAGVGLGGVGVEIGALVGSGVGRAGSAVGSGVGSATRGVGECDEVCVGDAAATGLTFSCAGGGCPPGQLSEDTGQFRPLPANAGQRALPFSIGLRRSEPATTATTSATGPEASRVFRRRWVPVREMAGDDEVDDSPASPSGAGEDRRTVSSLPILPLILPLMRQRDCGGLRSPPEHQVCVNAA
jgi:hypothetical protein